MVSPFKYKGTRNRQDNSIDYKRDKRDIYRLCYTEK